MKDMTPTQMYIPGMHTVGSVSPKKKRTLTTDPASKKKDVIPYFLKKYFGPRENMKQISGGFGVLMKDANNNINGIQPQQVANLFSRLFPAMPSLIANQAGKWFLKTMKDFDQCRRRL